MALKRRQDLEEYIDGENDYPIDYFDLNILMSP